MTNEKTYLEAGYIVGFKISMKGCRTLKRRDFQEPVADGEAEAGGWEIRMSCPSVKEDKAVRKLRKTILSRLSKTGFQGPFGFFFPYRKGQEMLDVLKECEGRITAYNKGAKHTSARMWYGIYPIASNDLRTGHLVWQEAADIVKRLHCAIANADVLGIRKVLREARGIRVENGLPQNVGDKLVSFYKEARELAVKLKYAAKWSKAEVERVMGEVDMSRIQLLRAAFVETTKEIGEKISAGSGFGTIEMKRRTHHSARKATPEDVDAYFNGLISGT